MAMKRRPCNPEDKAGNLRLRATAWWSWSDSNQPPECYGMRGCPTSSPCRPPGTDGSLTRVGRGRAVTRPVLRRMADGFSEKYRRSVCLGDFVEAPSYKFPDLR